MDPRIRVIAAVALLTLPLLIVAVAALIDRERLLDAVRSLPARLVIVGPFLAGLGLVLALNKGVQPLVVDVSFAFGYNATGQIYEIEGQFVLWLQELTPPSVMVYFSAVYVVGYVFLLVFPLIAYFCLQSPERLKQLLVAYGINYGVGVLLYSLVVAYGPRNLLYPDVSQPLYEAFPAANVLTTEINTNTNVFPSLHTSLAVTVMLFAWYTRDEYPIWFPIATVLALSVVVSTMALGIHWLIDVIAGAGLALLAVFAADPIVRRVDDWLEDIGESWSFYDSASW